MITWHITKGECLQSEGREGRGSKADLESLKAMSSNILLLAMFLLAKYPNFPNQLDSRCSDTWTYRRYFSSKPQHSFLVPTNLQISHVTKCIHSASRVSIILTNHNTIQLSKVQNFLTYSRWLLNCEFH